MSALIRTRTVTHLAEWVGDPDRSRAAGYSVGSTRPICGSVVKLGERGNSFAWIDEPSAVVDPRDLTIRKPCTRCAIELNRLIASAVALDAAYDEQQKR